MSDGTREPGEPVGKLSATDPLSPKRLIDSEKPRGDEPIKYVCMYVTLPILVGSKTVRLLRPTTTIVIEEGYTIELRFFLLLFSPFYFLLTYVVQCSFERS